MMKNHLKASDWLITAALTLVPAAFGGVFFIFIRYQDVVSPLYICIGVAYILLWGAAGYLCGRRLMPFYRLIIVNAVPIAAALAAAGMDIYAFFFDRTHDVPIAELYESFSLTKSYIGFAGVSFPALIARYMMNITAVNYNIFLVGLILLITPFAFCYINGFSHGLEINKNVPDIDRKDKDEAGSEGTE